MLRHARRDLGEPRRVVAHEEEQRLVLLLLLRKLLRFHILKALLHALLDRDLRISIGILHFIFAEFFLHDPFPLLYLAA